MNNLPKQQPTSSMVNPSNPWSSIVASNIDRNKTALADTATQKMLGKWWGSNPTDQATREAVAQSLQPGYMKAVRNFNSEDENSSDRQQQNQLFLKESVKPTIQGWNFPDSDAQSQSTAYRNDLLSSTANNHIGLSGTKIANLIKATSCDKGSRQDDGTSIWGSPNTFKRSGVEWGSAGGAMPDVGFKVSSSPSSQATSSGLVTSPVDSDANKNGYNTTKRSAIESSSLNQFSTGWNTGSSSLNSDPVGSKPWSGVEQPPSLNAVPECHPSEWSSSNLKKNGQAPIGNNVVSKAEGGSANNEYMQMGNTFKEQYELLASIGFDHSEISAMLEAEVDLCVLQPARRQTFITHPLVWTSTLLQLQGKHDKLAIEYLKNLTMNSVGTERLTEILVALGQYERRKARIDACITALELRIKDQEVGKIVQSPDCVESTSMFSQPLINRPRTRLAPQRTDFEGSLSALSLTDSGDQIIGRKTIEKTSHENSRDEMRVIGSWDHPSSDQSNSSSRGLGASNKSDKPLDDGTAIWGNPTATKIGVDWVEKEKIANPTTVKSSESGWERKSAAPKILSTDGTEAWISAKPQVQKEDPVSLPSSKKWPESITTNETSSTSSSSGNGNSPWGEIGSKPAQPALLKAAAAAAAPQNWLLQQQQKILTKRVEGNILFDESTRNSGSFNSASTNFIKSNVPINNMSNIFSSQSAVGLMNSSIPNHNDQDFDVRQVSSLTNSSHNDSTAMPSDEGSSSNRESLKQLVQQIQLAVRAGQLNAQSIFDAGSVKQLAADSSASGARPAPPPGLASGSSIGFGSVLGGQSDVDTHIQACSTSNTGQMSAPDNSDTSFMTMQSGSLLDRMMAFSNNEA